MEVEGSVVVAAALLLAVVGAGRGVALGGGGVDKAVPPGARQHLAHTTSITLNFCDSQDFLKYRLQQT